MASWPTANERIDVKRQNLKMEFQPAQFETAMCENLKATKTEQFWTASKPDQLILGGKGLFAVK